MRSPSRIAAAGITAAMASVILFVGAVGSVAAGPPVESYQAIGEARGFDVAFTFQGSLFERLLDLGVPHARSSVTSEAGGESRSSAAQLFPGDLVIGAAGEQIPGYRETRFPRQVPTDEPDDSHFSDTFQMPGSIGGGPFIIDTGHLVTKSAANSASGRATTNVVSLAPVIQITSLDVVSESTRKIDHVEHMAQTVVNGITIGVSEALTVTIGKLVATAETSSDGASPAAKTSLKISDVGVVMNGTPYRATIDDTGIRITGLPEDAAVIPGFVPQDVSQALQLVLDQANIRIATAQGTNTVDEVAADASLSGLLITFTGTIPNVFIPNAVSELLYGTIVPQLPEAIRKEFIEGSTCYKEDIKPKLPKQITSDPRFPDLPVCLSAQLIPGPGSGTVTTLSLGTVRSLSAAVQSEAIADPGTDGTVDGGFVAEPPLGGIVPPTDGGLTQPPAGNGGTVGRPAVLTGLVARLPSAALFAAGGVLLLLAMGIAIGPSLRQWRAIQEP